MEFFLEVYHFDLVMSSLVLSKQWSNSAPGQVIGQWQTSGEIENGREIQQKEHRQHLGSSEQHSTGGGLIQPPYVAKPQDEQVSNRPEHDRLPFSARSISETVRN